MTDEPAPTCGYLDCQNAATLYGPLWTSLDNNETYPTYACPAHTDGMAIIRHLGYPITDQPPGFPIHTERPQ
jgi:hypothetical protein